MYWHTIHSWYPISILVLIKYRDLINVWDRMVGTPSWTFYTIIKHLQLYELCLLAYTSCRDQWLTHWLLLLTFWDLQSNTLKNSFFRTDQPVSNKLFGTINWIFFNQLLWNHMGIHRYFKSFIIWNINRTWQEAFNFPPLCRLISHLLQLWPNFWDPQL